jgi:hypothetical protein
MKHPIRYSLTRGPKGEPICTGEDLILRFSWQLYPEASQKLYNHSPDGFEWGYAGSGPAQLALAILLDYLSQRDILPRLALQWYQEFKGQFIAPAPKHGAVITSEQIDNFIYSETHPL